MTKYRIVEKPTFIVIGRKTWISGQDNDLFGNFWTLCQTKGLFDQFSQLNGHQPGDHTPSSTLGISCVEKNPANRTFYYLIAIEKPETVSPEAISLAELETYHVPTAQWAVFECVGEIPAAIVKAEVFAFTEWLPTSGYEHAPAPEMEIYFPGNDGQSDDSYCEFWLPITKKSA